MTTKRIAQIDKRIAKIKTQLAVLGAMRPGSLTRQYKDPATGSGPYYQLSFTLAKKSRTDYIPRHSVSEVRRQIAQYQRFKTLSASWVALSVERCQWMMKLARTR